MLVAGRDAVARGLTLVVAPGVLSSRSRAVSSCFVSSRSGRGMAPQRAEVDGEGTCVAGLGALDLAAVDDVVAAR